jgi:hypothetical protein
MIKKTLLRNKKAFLSALVLAFLISFTSCGGEGDTEKEEEEMHDETSSNLVQLKSPEAANIQIEEVSLRSLKSVLKAPGKFSSTKISSPISAPAFQGGLLRLEPI